MYEHIYQHTTELLETVVRTLSVCRCIFSDMMVPTDTSESDREVVLLDTTLSFIIIFRLLLNLHYPINHASSAPRELDVARKEKKSREEDKDVAMSTS